jgi:hypothetical protein
MFLLETVGQVLADLEPDDEREPDIDDEPSPGSTRHVDQGQSCRSDPWLGPDREDDGEDLEDDGGAERGNQRPAMLRVTRHEERQPRQL